MILGLHSTVDLLGKSGPAKETRTVALVWIASRVVSMSSNVPLMSLILLLLETSLGS